MKKRVALLTLIFLFGCVSLTPEQIEDARFEQRKVDAVFFAAKAVGTCRSRGAEVSGIILNYRAGRKHSARCADGHEITE